jgi:hypothetical protein
MREEDIDKLTEEERINLGMKAIAIKAMADSSAEMVLAYGHYTKSKGLPQDEERLRRAMMGLTREVFTYCIEYQPEVWRLMVERFDPREKEEG